MSASLSLTVGEAEARAALLTVQRYDLLLDLTGLLDGDALRTVSTVTFSCSEVGADTFLECLGDVQEATLNGQPLPTGFPPDGRLVLRGLARDNVVVVTSVQRETGVGRGVHRSVDPLDGSVYVWTSFEPDDARVVFACFDQPDLKARFGIEVLAPGAWTVTSNSGAAEVANSGHDRSWRFADTPPLSTYVPVVNAGPFHETRGSRGGYDLGLYARASLAEQLDRDAEELFDLTARGLEFYGRRFEMAFPQSRYDQVFVPEMGGAMENYACITYSDSFLYREVPSYAQRELRAVVVLHEMAHMWFGDMVTMRWWSDLWLNESFAEWACNWCASQATEFTDTWAGTLARDELRAYVADWAPTTHPIRQPIPDTAAAAASFDAITYPKGAAALKQLVAYVGEDAFVAALVTYFRSYAWGNTTLDDLIAEIERDSGQDLSGWVKGWLGTSGTDELRLERSDAESLERSDAESLERSDAESLERSDADSLERSDAESLERSDADSLERSDAESRERSESSPVLHVRSPGGRPPLPHRLDIGVYELVEDQLRRTDTIAVRVEGAVTPLPPVPAGALLLVNDDDLTYASVRPDDSSLRQLLEHGGKLPTALGRTLAVTTAWDLLYHGLLSAPDFLRCVRQVLPQESAESVIEPLLSQAENIADYWSPAARRDELLSSLADLSLQLADRPSFRLPAVRTLARSATTPEQLDELAQRVDTADLRWRRLTRLAELGALPEDEVQQLLDTDPNPEAWVNAAIARSAQPDAEAKRSAWELAVTERKIGVDLMSRFGRAFWRPGQGPVLAPYRAAYRDGLAEMGESGMQWALAVAGYMFPWPAADPAFVDDLEAAAADPAVAPVVRQRVLERIDTLRRMLTSRAG